MTVKKAGPAPSMPVQVNVLPSKGMSIPVSANEAERAWLAQQAGVESVETFRADLTLKRWQRDGVKLSGNLRADLTQACIVTLEPVAGHAEETIERTFVPPDSRLAKPRLNSDGEWLLDVEGADPPDVLEADTLEIWGVLLEHFLLAIDPFPRAPGAVFSEAENPQAEDDRPPSPFAVLNKLKRPD